MQRLVLYVVVRCSGNAEGVRAYVLFTWKRKGHHVSANFTPHSPLGYMTPPPSSPISPPHKRYLNPHPRIQKMTQNQKATYCHTLCASKVRRQSYTSQFYSLLIEVEEGGGSEKMLPTSPQDQTLRFFYIIRYNNSNSQVTTKPFLFFLTPREETAIEARKPRLFSTVH